MGNFQISRGKFERLQRCANEQGVIAALAMDQRSSLKKSLEQAAGHEVAPDALITFKQRVTKVLTRYASAVLVDPEYGLSTLEGRTPGTGVLLSYEKTGFDPNVPGRLPSLLPAWNARRLLEVEADAVKVLLYYNPYDDERVNTVKQALIERVGAECSALDVPFFLEPLVYDERYDVLSLDFARLKPDYVRATIEEFSHDRYGIDMLKVEVPINIAYLRGSQAYQGGDFAYERASALEHFQAAAAAARKPFLYLSGGVSDASFRANLEMAAEAGVPFCGVLCGRATWKDGIAIFATEGADALEAWLLDQGIRNIQTLNATIQQTARPWHAFYGGLEHIEVIE